MSKPQNCVISSVDLLSHKNQQKLKNVFGKETKVEQLEAAAEIITKVQRISEQITIVQNRNSSDRLNRIGDFIKRQISKRIHKISSKVHKISESSKQSLKPEFRGAKFDFLRNDDAFNYEIDTNQHRSAQKFETDMRRLENVEMTRLTESIEAVNKLFVNMSNLVFEQGTIIDRIDMNIVTTVAKVDEANTQLIRAIEHQNGGLADQVIKILSIVVVALAILLFLKYSE